MGRIFRYGSSRDHRVHHRRRIFGKIAIMVSTTAEIDGQSAEAPHCHPHRPLGARSLAGGNTRVREIIAHGRHIGLHAEVKIQGGPKVIVCHQFHSDAGNSRTSSFGLHHVENASTKCSDQITITITTSLACR